MAGALAAAAIAAIAPADAGAATLTVTTTDETSASACTLNDAITSANSNFNWGACTATDLPYGADTINITATGTMNRTGIVTPVFTPMDINGPGSDLLDIHRQSGGDYRLFANNPGTTTSLSGVTLSNGRVVDDTSLFAGGLSNQGTLTLDDVVVRDSHSVATSDDADPLAAGGGIYNAGTLTLRHSIVADNSVDVTQTATSGAWDAVALGGGILNNDTLTIERSTISGNTASASVASADPDASAAAGGGGIANNLSLTLTASTVSGNESVASAPAPATTSERGGGVHTSGTLVAAGDTIAYNTAAQSANLTAAGDQTLTSTILFSEGEPNCDGSVTDGGFNLEFPASCTGLAGAVHADPLLGTLADNGGPTFTHALGGLSPALDKGKAAGATTDQRDLSRPVDLAIANAAGGDGTDIGAFEAQDGDADGVNDAADLCPAVDGGGNASGCPSAARTLTLKYSVRRERFKGTLVAPGFADCQQGRAVTVWKKRAGDDQQVGQPTTDANGKYSLDKRGRPGKHYYTSVEEEVVAPIAECLAATSPTIKVPG